MIRRVAVGDWGPFGSAEVDFAALGRGRVVLVVGRNEVADYADRNGVGKSRLWKAVCWALFGRYPGMRSVKAPIRRGAGRGAVASVEVELDVAGGVLVVRRERSASGSSVTTRLNGGAEQSWDAQVANQRVEDLLGLDEDRYLRLLAHVGSFSIAAASDARLKDMLDALLPVGLAAIQKPLADEAVLAERAAEAHQDALRRAREAAPRADDEWAVARRREVEWDASRAARAAAAGEAAEQHAAAASMAETSLAAWEAHLAELLTTEDASARGASTDGAVLSHRRAVEAAASARRMLERADADLARALRDVPPGMCPSCGQGLPADMLREASDRHAAHVASLRAAVDDRRTAVAEADRVAQDAAAAYEAARAAAASAATSIEVRRTAVASIEELRRRAGESRRAEVAARTSAEHERRAENPHSETARAAWDRQQKANAELVALEAETPRVERELALRRYLGQLGGRKGLQHFALSRLFPAISARAAAYAAYLSPAHLRLGLEADPDRERFRVVMDYEDAGEGHGEVSDSEQVRGDLCLFLAFFDHAVASFGFDPGIVVLDEVLDRSTDRVAKSRMLALLDDYAARSGRLVLLVTNDDAVIEDSRRPTIVVTRRVGGSVMETRP